MSATVAALLVDDAGRLLFGLRAMTKASYPGTWDAPGGHIEPGETPDQALIREVREELGVEIDTWTALRTIEFMEGGQIVPCHVFAVAAWTGVPSNACDEHDELRWFSLADVAKLSNLASTAYPLLAAEAVDIVDRHAGRGRLVPDRTAADQGL